MLPLHGRQELGVWETFHLPDSPVGWLLFSPFLWMRTLRLGEADQISQSPDGKTPLALDGSTAPGAELLGLFLLGPGPLTGGMGAVGGPWAGQQSRDSSEP